MEGREDAAPFNRMGLFVEASARLEASFIVRDAFPVCWITNCGCVFKRLAGPELTRAWEGWTSAT